MAHVSDPILSPPGGATTFDRRAWLLAARPRTLAVAIGPIAVGTSVAASDGAARFWPAFAALLGAVLLQLGSNFANDVYDFEKGADTDDRVGPPRATQLGLLSPAQMRQGMWCVFGAAVLVGFYLVAVGGWPIVAIGVASIVAAITYTGGPWPFGYHGLGDVMVFLFFGVVAVVGTFYVQTLDASGAVFLASLPVGALSTATLVVNNVRDRETDIVAGKNTLAVRLGARGGRFEYVALVAFAYWMLPVFHLVCERSFFIYLPLLTLPRACGLLDRVFRNEDAATLNEALGATAQLGLFYSLLLALGWWL
ncbi:MAG: 1,4-dihydroxy-2-naphthoate polyprenyltransferase [Myxococcota bacterium]|nr:1,4-dihydroxy-2-naphthoate polyprenyltransferase [Myxococcota bacterium]